MTATFIGIVSLWVFRFAVPSQQWGPLEGKVNHVFEEGDELTGELQSFWTGDDSAGDSMLLWQSPSGKRIWL
jgi:hypothetical protein